MLAIRTANPQDIPTLAVLEKLCNPNPWSEQQLKTALFPPNHIWLGEHHSHIISMLVWQQQMDEIEIHLLNTHPNYRGHGFASQLLNQLKITAQQQLIQRILLEVRDNNTVAKRLYQQHGFTVCGIRKGYYQPDNQDALLMEYLC